MAIVYKDRMSDSIMPAENTTDPAMLDTGFENWLNALPSEIRHLDSVSFDDEMGEVVLRFERTGFTVSQALTEKLLRHGFVFKRLRHKYVYFQRVRPE